MCIFWSKPLVLAKVDLTQCIQEHREGPSANSGQRKPWCLALKAQTPKSQRQFYRLECHRRRLQRVKDLSFDQRHPDQVRRHAVHPRPPPQYTQTSTHYQTAK